LWYRRYRCRDANNDYYFCIHFVYTCIFCHDKDLQLFQKYISLKYFIIIFIIDENYTICHLKGIFQLGICNLLKLLLQNSGVTKYWV